jgi:nucleotide-binding universal stress UspA family protein
MIVDVAREVDADLIIVGTRGHTPMVELLLGSVTQRLLHIATCPVLAVPPARQTGVDASEGEAAEAAR